MDRKESKMIYDIWALFILYTIVQKQFHSAFISKYFFGISLHFMNRSVEIYTDAYTVCLRTNRFRTQVS